MKTSRYTRILALFALLALLMLGVGARAELSAQQRGDIFRAVWTNVAHWYPYFGEKGVDWEQVKADYAPRVAVAADDQAFYQLICQMLRGLHDGHTEVLDYPHQYSPNSAPAIRLMEAEGQVAVAEVRSGSQADQAGVKAGMAITAVNGVPVQDIFQAFIDRVTAYSTLGYARAAAIDYLLTGPPDRNVRVTFDDGQVLELTREASVPLNVDYDISSRRLPDDIGYLRIPTWEKNMKVVPQVDQALEEVKDTRALIIDVRGNSGGYPNLATKVIGRLLEKSVRTTTVVQHLSILDVRITAPRYTRTASPRGPWHYDKPVVVLTDPCVFSTGEYFVAAMKDSGRATIIGQTTAGSSGYPKKFKSGPIEYRVSTAREYRQNGQLIEGLGVEPDIPVVVRLDDLRAGKDPWMEAALTFLHTKLAPTAATTEAATR